MISLLCEHIKKFVNFAHTSSNAHPWIEDNSQLSDYNVRS